LARIVRFAGRLSSRASRSADRYPKTPASPPSGGLGEACQGSCRRELRGKADGSRTLEGKNPKGASSFPQAKHQRAATGLRGRAKAQELAAATSGRCASSHWSKSRRKPACGFGVWGKPHSTSREENAPQGEIPGTLSGRKRPDQASRGVSRREGSQTLRAERGGRLAMLALEWTLVAGMC
jgi:hypothetical protein